MEEMYTLKKPEYIKPRKRVGRGTSSGHGKTSCRGQKGQMSRAGAKRRAWFEGGQMPIQRRVPKRGFNNKFKTTFQIVNLKDLVKLATAGEINPKVMKDYGLIKNANLLVKVLGSGDFNNSCNIVADAFSTSAKEKIQKAGGKISIRVIEKTVNNE